MSAPMDCLPSDVAWSEAKAPPEVEEAVFTVIARKRSGALLPVGNAFVVKALSDSALAITAAHVLREIHRLQLGDARRVHPTTLPEFAPVPPPIDLSLENIVLATIIGGQLVFAVALGAAFDEYGDFGVLEIRPQDKRQTGFRLREFIVDDRIPDCEQVVAIAGYRYLEIRPDGPQTLRFARQMTLRVGKVTNVFPNGQRLCHGPCFETSIPVYSGMSGGPAVALDADGRLQAIGLVCSDPDQDTPNKDNPSIAGRSLMAKLPVKRISGSKHSRQHVQFEFRPTNKFGSFLLSGSRP